MWAVSWLGRENRPVRLIGCVVSRSIRAGNGMMVLMTMMASSRVLQGLAAWQLIGHVAPILGHSSRARIGMMVMVMALMASRRNVGGLATRPKVGGPRA